MVLKMYNWKSVSGDGDAFRVWKTEKICFNYIKFHLTGLTDCVIVKNALLWQHVPTILRTKKFCSNSRYRWACIVTVNEAPPGAWET